MANSDNVIQYSNGGAFGSTAIAGANSETLVYTGAGRLCQISVITVGTVAVSVYDGTQSTGGTLIFTSATNPTGGTIYLNDWPITTGICVKGTSTASHGVVVSYNKAGVNGNA